MFDNPVLDVAIGLIFVFLLYSLLATTLKELLATIFSYRPRMLALAIERMLDGKQYSYYWWNKLQNIAWWLFHAIWFRCEQLFRWIRKVLKKSDINPAIGPGKLEAFMQNKPLEKGKRFRRRKLNKKSALFASKFFQHPIYKRAAEDSIFNKKPAYMAASSFSDVLIDLLSPVPNKPALLSDLVSNIADLRGKNAIKEGTQQILMIYINQANGDQQRFKLLLEDWYNDSMDRVSGWYKRQAYKILFIIGLVLAVAFNVDTIKIVSKLSDDKDARAALVRNASAYVAEQSKSYQPAKPAITVQSASKKIDSSGIVAIKDIYRNNIAEQNTELGLGWHTPLQDDLNRYCALDRQLPFWFYFIWWSVLPAMTGFLLTALAISLGAPFWFDLLNKFVNLRVSGKKPDDTPALGKTTTLNQKPLPNSFG